MQALIFDFDGVVMDSEPIHFEAFRQSIAPLGVDFSWDTYCADYLGFDDREGFAAILTDAGVDLATVSIPELIEAKTQIVQHLLATATETIPGTVEMLVAASDAGIPVAICSGALRIEVEVACRALEILPRVRTIVGADDVEKSKPDPESYRLAIARLSEILGSDLDPAQCVAIEDSPVGLQSAIGAGMKTCALATSYAKDELTMADRVVANLTELTLDDLSALSG
ncbi:MAG: HAD family phosphatase [Phycisphaerales bacterium]|jgi:beta-phosphoglucomutase|nr:HAD family phosphatase [Phycisphaerales bacterium]MBT7171658.1 HAD family phosphatase [Phycisphaerales bacterium]